MGSLRGKTCFQECRERGRGNIGPADSSANKGGGAGEGRSEAETADGRGGTGEDLAVSRAVAIEEDDWSEEWYARGVDSSESNSSGEWYAAKASTRAKWYAISSEGVVCSSRVDRQLPTIRM